MKKRSVFILTAFLLCGLPSVGGYQAAAQTSTQQKVGTMSGIVSDENGEPLIGVSVLVKGTKNAVSTDIDGKYTIRCAADAKLVFSYVGYESQEVTASKAKNIEMVPSSVSLSEVTVTAEFGLKRVARSIGSSVQNVKAADIQDSGRSDFISALQGRVSGMSVTQSSGAPGASTTVVLRSITSLSGNNQPLYVVDGVPMNNSTFNPSSSFAVADAQTPRDSDFASRGNDFNPEEIESMTVLKGAAAAALYGSDASNGAIIITTKKGQSGRAKVTYSNQFSWSKAYGWPERQTKYANGAYGTTNYYYTSNYGGLYTGELPLYDNTEALLQTGFAQRHNLSVEAGNDKMSLRASGSWLKQEGVMKTTDLERSNFTVAGRAELTKWLTFEGSMQYIHQTNNKAGRGLGGPLDRAYRWPIVDDMSNYLAEDGLHMRYPDYYTDTDLLNPIYALYKNKNNDKTDRILSIFSLNITPIEHTFVRANFGWDFSSSTYINATHPYYRSDNQAATDGGVYNISKYNTSDPSVNILAGYNNDFGKFNIGAQVGYHSKEDAVNSLASYGTDFLLIDFYSINNCNTETVRSSKKETKRRLQAISGQVEVGYDNTAFATFRFRNDWSSTLPKDNNSFFYPAVELSYVASELPFMQNLTWLDFLKIRGSYAQVGKDAPALSIDPQLETTGLWGGGYHYGWTGPNPGLKPEMNTSWEVGFEGRFWDNRVNADFTYFWTHCSDQIVTGFRLSYATGFVLNNMNVGDFKTWGWEAHVDVDVVRTRDFTWNVGVNASHTGSEVVDLPDNVSEYYNAYTWNSGGIRNGIMKGHPITTVTGYKYKRTYDGHILINPSNGAPIIDSSKWQVLGDREPKLRYGISTSLRYKGFHLSALFAGRYHATVVNGTQRDMNSRGLSWQSVEMREKGGVVFEGILDDGTYVEDDKEPLGGRYEGTPTKNNIMVDLSHYGSSIYTGTDEDWVQDKINYLRCQELRLSYNVPGNFIKKYTAGLVSNASLYVSGNDLFTITNYTGTDPVGNTMAANAGGTGGEGIDVWGLPSPRTYSFGLKLTF